MCILYYKKSSEPIYGAPRPRYRSVIGFQVIKLHARQIYRTTKTR